MQKTILPALIVALISGLAIGIQAAFISAAGKIAGAVLTGLLVTFMGGDSRWCVFSCHHRSTGEAGLLSDPVSNISDNLCGRVALSRYYYGDCLCLT